MSTLDKKSVGPACAVEEADTDDGCKPLTGSFESRLGRTSPRRKLDGENCTQRKNTPQKDYKTTSENMDSNQKLPAGKDDKSGKLRPTGAISATLGSTPHPPAHVQLLTFPAPD